MSTQTISDRTGESIVRPISEARLAANRANSQYSTGPRTPEGKAAVANNALKHGLRSERTPLDLAADAALPHEQTPFLETLQALKEDLAPVGQLETLLLERLAQLDLRLGRALRMETAHLSLQSSTTIRELTAAGSKIATDTGAHRDNGLSMMAFLRDPNALTLIGRYESRLSRDFARTLTQFHQAQKLRKQTQQSFERPQLSGTGSSVPSEISSTSSDEASQARVDIGACPPTDEQVPNESQSASAIFAEQTQSTSQSTGSTPISSAQTPSLHAPNRKGQSSPTTM